MGYLSDDELRDRALPLVKSGYGRYLLDALEREILDRPAQLTPSASALRVSA
jgi:glucose-1-phosphate thymidylyltransferase